MKEKKEELKKRIKDLEKDLFDIAGKVSDTINELLFRAFESGDEKLIEVADRYTYHNKKADEIVEEIESTKKELTAVIIEEASSKIVDMIMKDVKQKEILEEEGLEEEEDK